MIRLIQDGAYVVHNKDLILKDAQSDELIRSRYGINTNEEMAKSNTISHRILREHNEGDHENLKLRFDSITSHDITYVGIIQTARASGMEQFPLPYVMTNCHNSLCAVGGTINEDDHKFSLSAAKKYGGIYVPPNLAVIHSYNREMMAGCGKMILGSDSHTRYGALGTMAVGEGGGELAKQLLRQTYDMKYPDIVGVYLENEPSYGVGPQDVSLAIIQAVFDNGFVKNAVMEFVGPGIKNLPMEYRNGIDVMTTETTCWSSIWATDEEVEKYLDLHGRKNDYALLEPKEAAYYDKMIYVDLSKIEPSIALPFHPSNVVTIRELKANPTDILRQIEIDSRQLFESSDIRVDATSHVVDGEIRVQQGIIAGCAGGTFDNIVAAAEILKGASTGNQEFSLSVYPGSQPAYMELVRNGSIVDLMSAGVTVKSAFCGPCFGAGDTPANGEFSIRHVTRNFPSREGSKPNEEQYSLTALMDARSIAATARNSGVLTGADEIDVEYKSKPYFFDASIYEKRVYDGFGKGNPEETLVLGPNIKDWPEMPALSKNLLLRVDSHITDPVTTTDELIPSGETSSYRSNPLKLAEFTLSRKDPGYVARAKETKALEERRRAGTEVEELASVEKTLRSIEEYSNLTSEDYTIGSTIFAIKPGDGSAREQAASCQRVLGASANLAEEYATKRYRSNLINWGILPFHVEDAKVVSAGDYIFVPGIRKAVEEGAGIFKAYVIRGDEIKEITLHMESLSEKEKGILVAGSLINYNRKDQ